MIIIILLNLCEIKSAGKSSNQKPLLAAAADRIRWLSFFIANSRNLAFLKVVWLGMRKCCLACTSEFGMVLDFSSGFGRKIVVLHF